MKEEQKFLKFDGKYYKLLRLKIINAQIIPKRRINLLPRSFNLHNIDLFLNTSVNEATSIQNTRLFGNLNKNYSCFIINTKKSIITKLL